MMIGWIVLMLGVGYGYSDTDNREYTEIWCLSWYHLCGHKGVLKYNVDFFKRPESTDMCATSEQCSMSSRPNAYKRQ